MLNKSSKVVSLFLIIFILVSFIVSDYAIAQSINYSATEGSDDSQYKKVGIGALVILGIFGIYKLIKNNREKKYQEYLAKGKIYLQKKNYELAINNLSEAEDINDSTEVTSLLYEAKTEYKKKHYQLGNKYLEEGNWGLAYQEFERVRVYDRNYLDINQKYNRAYQKLRELKLKRIAVLNFEDNTYRYNLGSRVSSLFTAQLLNKNPKFIDVIERDKLNEILEEQKLGASGLVDSSTAKELGNILGVDYLVVGEVLSGSVTEDKGIDYVELFDGTQEKEYTVVKEAYTQIVFKLLDVSNGSITFSKKIKKKDRFKESYYQGQSIIIPSDEEMIDNVITAAVDEFAWDVYNKYEM